MPTRERALETKYSGMEDLWKYSARCIILGIMKAIAATLHGGSRFTPAICVCNQPFAGRKKQCLEKIKETPGELGFELGGA